MIWRCGCVTYTCNSSSKIVEDFKCPKDCTGQCDICLRPYENEKLNKGKYNEENPEC